jgi:hypothetical protein
MDSLKRNIENEEKKSNWRAYKLLELLEFVEKSDNG